MNEKCVWVWRCRDCKKEYPENDKSLIIGKGFADRPLLCCPDCDGVVDLCPDQASIQRARIKNTLDFFLN